MTENVHEATTRLRSPIARPVLLAARRGLGRRALQCPWRESYRPGWRNAGLVALIVSLALALPALAAAPDSGSRAQDAETELLHANTYYWLGRARNDSGIESHRALRHVEAAERIAAELPPGPVKQKILLRISENKAQIREQFSHQSEELAGQSRLLSTLLVDDDIIEFSNDAIETAFENGLRNLFEGTAGTRIQMISDILFLLPLSDDRDPYIEELARRSLGDLTDHYVIGRHEAAAALTPEEFESLYADPIPPETLEALIDGLDSPHIDVPGIAIVHLVKKDQIGDVHYAGVYYRYWETGGSGFEKHWYADGFGEQGNRNANFAALLLLLALPLQWLLVAGTRRLERQLSQHASRPPAWLALAAAGLSAVILALSLQGVRALSPDLEVHPASLESILWYCGLGIGAIFVPLIFTALVGARIPTVAKCINNADVVACLVAGSMLGSLTVLTYFSWMRIGLSETVLLLAMAIPTLSVLSLQLGRAYSDHAIRESQGGLVQTAILVAGIAGYSLCILSWNPVTLGYGSVGVLALVGFASLIPILLKKLKDRRETETRDEDQKEDKTSLEWLRRTVAEPEFIASQKLEGLLAEAQKFVTETGLEDDLIEVVCVRSQAGAGKTRFARELGERISRFFEARGEQCTVLFGDCDDPESPDAGATAYEPFAQAMGGMLGVRRFDDPTRNARALQNGLAEKGLQTVMAGAGLGALGSLLDVSDDSENEIRKTTQAEMAKTIAGALSSISRQERIVFILDDVQWIDSDTQELLERVLGLLPAQFEENEVSFVLTSRSEDADPLAPLLERLSETEKVLSVHPVELPTDDENRTDWIDQLFEQLRFDYSSQEKIRRFVTERGYTLPLHIVQLVAMLVDRGWVEQLGDGFRLAEGSVLENLKAPKDFDQLLEAQTEGLDPRLVDYLHCCAVIGRRFRVSLVASIFEIDVLELLSLLKTAESRQIIRDDPKMDDFYEFCDKRTVSMFRNRAPAGGEAGAVMQAVREYRKRFVRQQSGALVAKFGAVEKAPYAEVSALASHAAAVKESLPREALEFCRIAAEMSQKRGLFGRAVEYFEQAISVFTSAKDERVPRAEQVRILLLYVSSLQDAQQKLETVDHNLERIRELFSDCPESELTDERVEFDLCRALRAYRGRRFDDATNYSQAAIESANATPAQRVRAAFYAAASLPPQDPEKRREAHEAVVADAERLLAGAPDPRTETLIEAVLSEACNNLGFVLLNGLRDPDAARSRFERARELNLRPALNDKKGLAISLGGLGDCAKQGGDREAARSFYEQNLDISKETGDLQGIGRMTSMLAGLDLEEAGAPGSDRRALLRSARSRYEESLDVSEKQGNLVSCAFAHAGLLRVADEEGSTDLIRHELERAGAFAERARSSSPPLPEFAAGELRASLEAVADPDETLAQAVQSVLEKLGPV